MLQCIHDRAFDLCQMQGYTLFTQITVELQQGLQRRHINAVHGTHQQHQMMYRRMRVFSREQSRHITADLSDIGEIKTFIHPHQQDARHCFHLMSPDIAEMLGSRHPTDHRQVWLAGTPNHQQKGQAHTQQDGIQDAK